MSLVQVISRNLTVGSTTQTTVAISTTPGNCLLFCAVYNPANAGAVTPSDSTNQTWVPVFNSPYPGNATGLTLAVWAAKNIAGALAAPVFDSSGHQVTDSSGNPVTSSQNTFTFVTTGNDTPSIFIIEFSGRDKSVPIDLTVTASDVGLSIGSHTTGVILAKGGDDVLAFVASGAQSQAFAAGAGWAIPANGAVTTALGYDAFVQSQNSVLPGPISNTYSVTLSDKLDAIIIGLAAPRLAYSDEFYDDFNEVVDEWWIDEPQLISLTTAIPDVDHDWLDDVGENDAWVLLEDQSSACIPDVATNSFVQYFGEDAELYDEALDNVPFPGTYQSSDNFPPIYFEEPWDWFQEIDDDEWTFRDTDILSANAPDLVSQVITDPWDWDEDPDDFFADDFGNDDSDQPKEDAWDHWTTDDDDQVLDDTPQLVDFNAAILFLNLEDGWDQEHFATLDADEQWTQDDYQNASNPLLNLEDAWDHFTTDDDDYVVTDDFASVNNNGDVNVDDSWDWTQEDDDYSVIDDYQIVDVIINTSLTAEDAFDWFPNDPDDELFHSLNTDPVGPTLIIPFSMPVEDPWDWTQAEDDYSTPDNDFTVADVAQSFQVPVEDAWDWSGTDDDDYWVDDTTLAGNNTPIVVDDAWEHCTTDPDDEWFITAEYSAVEPFRALLPEDPWDHWTQDSDDEEWVFRNCDAVAPFIGLNAPTDGWDHFTTDDDDYAVSDDYAKVDLVIAPSQFTDESWDWFYESAEDTEQDYALEPAKLPDSVYNVNPNYEVYMAMRTFTVIWLPNTVSP